MQIIVYLLGFGSIAISSCLILYPRATIDLYRGLYQKYPLTYIAALAAVFGLFFLIAAPITTYPWFFRIIGVLFLLEALLAFFNPQKIYNRMLEWYFMKVSDQTQRLFGIIGVIFGTAILSWV
jgi:uncharacterized protein YjeT (DUF2065 family)